MKEESVAKEAGLCWTQARLAQFIIVLAPTCPSWAVVGRHAPSKLNLGLNSGGDLPQDPSWVCKEDLGGRGAWIELLFQFLLYPLRGVP